MKSKEETIKFLQKLITQKKSEKTDSYPIKEKRYTELLKYPEKSLLGSDEWFVYVPQCFNDCLDIAKTDRVIIDKQTKEKQTKKIWTQGSRFSFHRGCILYDTPEAYLNWAKAINEIKYCISIHCGEDAKPAMGKEERKSGRVEFSILVKGFMTNKLESKGEFTLSQDEFVKFLIIGNHEILPV